MRLASRGILKGGRRGSQRETVHFTHKDVGFFRIRKTPSQVVQPSMRITAHANGRIFDLYLTASDLAELLSALVGVAFPEPSTQS
jgi:hypothetical protein